MILSPTDSAVLPALTGSKFSLSLLDSSASLTTGVRSLVTITESVKQRAVSEDMAAACEHHNIKPYTLYGL